LLELKLQQSRVGIAGNLMIPLCDSRNRPPISPCDRRAVIVEKFAAEGAVIDPMQSDCSIERKKAQNENK
jgi:hypothetical protein